MRSYAHRVCILALCLSAHCFASEVLRVGKDAQLIAVTHDPGRTWTANQRVCILQRAQEVACGTVLKSTPKGAVVRLDSANQDVMAGDKVVGKAATSTGALLAPSQKRSQTPNAPATARVRRKRSFNVTVGAAMGTYYFYPVAAFNFAFLPHFSVGFGGSFLTARATGTTIVNLSGIGILGNLAYFSKGHHQGLWIQAGGGLQSFSATGGASGPESASSLMVFATAGWRHQFDFGLNFGAGAGASLIPDPNLQTINASLFGMRPLLIIDAGFAF